MSSDDPIKALGTKLAAFALERDWDQFHSPRNLAAALSVEVGEVLEHFQWLSDAQSAALNPDKKTAIAQELADVFIYLIRLADKLGIDLIETAHDKIAANAKKYPADLVRGSARKYDEY